MKGKRQFDWQSDVKATGQLGIGLNESLFHISRPKWKSHGLAEGDNCSRRGAQNSWGFVDDKSLFNVFVSLDDRPCFVHCVANG